MLQKKIKLFLFIAMVGLLAYGAYTQYLLEPDKPPVPESIRRPLEAMQEILGGRSGELQEEIQGLAQQIEERFADLKESAPPDTDAPGEQPPPTPVMSAQPRTAGPAVETATPQGLPELKAQIESSLEQLNQIDAPELAERMRALYQRVQERIESQSPEQPATSAPMQATQ